MSVRELNRIAEMRIERDSAITSRTWREYSASDLAIFRTAPRGEESRRYRAVIPSSSR